MSKILRDRILIIGGTGFIGRNLTQFCIEKGLSCSVMSLNKPDEQHCLFGVEYLVADLRNVNGLLRALQSCEPFDYVVNLSGYVDHSSFLNGGRQVIGAHFIGVMNLLQVLDRSILKCFVQVGTSDEYGNLPAPQNELMRESPITPYSLSKLSSTYFLQMLHRAEDFPVVILRLFLVYGERQNTQRFLPQAIEGCLSNKEFATSEGEQIRDFCHVDDISRGILAALDSRKALGEVINIASGVPVSIRTVIEKVQSLTGGGLPLFGVIPYRKGENMHLFANIKKATALLEWAPKISLDDGLRRTVLFHKQKKIQK